MSATLAIMPTFLRSPADLEVTLRTIQKLQATQPGLDLLVVDDHSPVVELWEGLVGYAKPFLSASKDNFIAHRMDENGGFARAVNHGLRTALLSGQDALLVNADLEFLSEAWLPALENCVTPDGSPADIAGALLVYPQGFIQHAGIYFSLLTRQWDHWYRFAPYQLPEAHIPRVCPVTGALQFIQHSTLEKIGVYDEDFRMSYEDVDYCLRAFAAGLTCVYTPKAMALHHESLFRGNKDEKIKKWEQESWRLLQRKHADTPTQAFYPDYI